MADAKTVDRVTNALRDALAAYEQRDTHDTPRVVVALFGFRSKTHGARARRTRAQRAAERKALR
jgi:hypothetical protein